MATSKTLTPTNVTISIPEFTDQPDQRVNSNCIDKEADAINAVNTKLTTADAQSMTNLNDVTSTGLYSYDKLSSAMTNAPSTGTYFSGTLRVTYYNANKVTQEFIESGGRVFTRHKWNGTWGSWVELLSFSNTVPTTSWTKITSYTSGAEWNGSYYIKLGNIVYLRISAKSLTANSNITVFTLPTDYRPPFEIEFGGFGGNAYLNHAHFKILSNGNLNVYSADTYAAGFISYPAGN